MNFLACAWKVKPILESMPETRDDDRKLIAEVWRREINVLNKQERDAISLLDEHQLENPETITRVRRKLQETNTSLRGKKWDARHNMEAFACQQLNFFESWNW